MKKHFFKITILLLLALIIIIEINNIDFLLTFLTILIISSTIYQSFIYAEKAGHSIKKKNLTNDYFIFLSNKNVKIKDGKAFLDEIALYNTQYKFKTNTTKMCKNYYFEKDYNPRTKIRIENLKHILKEFPDFEDFSFKIKNNKIIIRFVKSKPIKIMSLDYLLNKLQWPEITEKEFNLIINHLKE